MEGLCSFHNKVKEALLREALENCRSGGGLSVLDFACGCLGDIHKYSRAGRIGRVVAVDLDGQALKEAQRRSKPYSGRLDVDILRPMDCTDLERVSGALAGEKFDLVVCNFAVQYFASCSGFMPFVRRHMKGPQSAFVGCVMNGDKVDLATNGGDTFSNEIVCVRKEHEDFAVTMRETSRYYAERGASISEPIFRPDAFISSALNSGFRLVAWRSFAEYAFPARYTPAQAQTSALYDTFEFRSI